MIGAVVWIAGACLAWWIGHRKGMTSLGVLLGVVFAVVGAIIMACIPRRFQPVWQGWMRRLHGRGRIIVGALLLLAWMFVPSISHSGVSIAQEHAECQGGLGSVAQLFDPGIAVDCNDISTLYTFLTLAAAAGLVLVLWGVWAAWGTLLREQGRRFSATARPAPPQQYPPPAPRQPPVPACTCGADHEPGDVFCGRCGRPVRSPVPRPG